MSNPTTFNSDDAIFDQVLQRAVTDRAYRGRLVEQPESAIEEVIGVPLATLPNQVRVKFIEKEEGIDSLIVLPDFADAEGSLSEAELEAVAGGDGCWTSCGLTICLMTDNNEVKVCTVDAN